MAFWGVLPCFGRLKAGVSMEFMVMSILVAVMIDVSSLLFV